MQSQNKKRNPIARQLRHWKNKIIKCKKRYDRKANRNLVQESFLKNG